MRILITGAGGFVGSYAARQLLADGHELALLLRPRSNPWRIRDVLLRTQVIAGDMKRLSNVRREIKAFCPETVVHCAWQGVGNGARNDAAQDTNIVAALELVNIAARAGARNWIGIGSQAEYGPCSQRITEDFPTRPTTRYGQAKLATCREADKLCEELGVRFAWLRLFSTYGPGDDPTWLIPYLAGILLCGERPVVTAGEQLWDYIYISDVATAIARVVESDEARGVFNLGSGTTSTIRSIIENVRALIDPRLPIGFGEAPYRPDQVMHLEADISRLASLGWRPQVELHEGLAKAVAWYRQQASQSLAA